MLEGLKAVASCSNEGLTLEVSAWAYALMSLIINVSTQVVQILLGDKQPPTQAHFIDVVMT